MKRYRKLDYPVDEVRRLLEPGPVVLVSSAWKGQRNVMTLGWHTVLAFTPSLLGTMISSGNHSFDLIRRSRQCVINLPTADLLDTVVGIGNCSGAEVDKFERFGWTPPLPTTWTPRCWRSARPASSAGCTMPAR